MILCERKSRQFPFSFARNCNIFAKWQDGQNNEIGEMRNFKNLCISRNFVESLLQREGNIKIAHTKETASKEHFQQQTLYGLIFCRESKRNLNLLIKICEISQLQLVTFKNNFVSRNLISQNIYHSSYDQRSNTTHTNCIQKIYVRRINGNKEGERVGEG